MTRILLKDATVIDREGTVTPSRTIVVEDGRIAGVYDNATEAVDAAQKSRATASSGPAGADKTGTIRAGATMAGAALDEAPIDVIECSHLVVTPGLVNLHTHSPMTIFRGIAEDATPDRWFNEEIWPYESLMDADDVETGAWLAAAEMAANGVTAYADHYFMADRICAAALGSGLRADVAPTLFGMAGDFSGQLSRARDLIQEWNGRDGRLSLRLGPHSPYTCTPDQLAACARMAADLGAGAHLHVEDGQQQIAASIDAWGRTPFQVVADSGLMEVPLIVGHGYWILDEERKLLGDQTWLAVCMKTYMKLGEGPGRVWQRPDELPLCIGTDGAASSNTLSPLEQARLLALVGKYNNGNAETFTLKEIWRILMRGHDALPFGTGAIRAGAPADLVLWDLRRPGTWPVYNPLAAIVYSADASNVHSSMVAGHWVKKDGTLCIDTDTLLTRASQRAAGILCRGKGRTSLAF